MNAAADGEDLRRARRLALENRKLEKRLLRLTAQAITD